MNNSNKLKNSSSNKSSLKHGDLILSSPINNYCIYCFYSPPWQSSAIDDIEPNGHFKILPNILGIILQSKPGPSMNHCLVLWTNGSGSGWTDDQHLKIISNNNINTLHENP